MRNSDVIKARCRQRLVERGRDVGGTHRGTEPPGHDVAREVVEHGREVVPAPAGDFEVGEVGLPELVDGRISASSVTRDAAGRSPFQRSVCTNPISSSSIARFSINR